MFVTMAYCNGCHKPASNANRIPSGWVEFHSAKGDTYHYCKVCVIRLVSEGARVPLDPHQDARNGGETISLVELRHRNTFA